MYTHDITERNFYNIHYITYIYICIHFNFLIYGISMEIVIFFVNMHIQIKKMSSVIVFIYMLFI